MIRRAFWWAGFRPRPRLLVYDHTTTSDGVFVYRSIDALLLADLQRVRAR